MAPRTKTAPAKRHKRHKRQPETDPLDLNPIVKKPSGARVSLRLQNRPPASHAAQSRPVQPSVILPAPKRMRLQGAKAETKEEIKDEWPARQHRRCTPSRLKHSGENLRKYPEAEVKANEPEGVHPSEQLQELLPLSEDDLQSLYKEVMDFATNRASPLRQVLSRDTISTADSARFQRPPIASYRHDHLKAVQIHIHAEPPDYINAAINHIIGAGVSRQRRAELRIIAQKLRSDCFGDVKGRLDGGGFINPLHNALKALGLENLHLCEKADWREELKPAAQQPLYFSSGFLTGDQQQEVDDVSARPQKRQKCQQQSTSECVFPESSRTNAPTLPQARNSRESSMTSPPAPPFPHRGDRYLIRNACPDLSIGIRLEALVSALSSPNLDTANAAAFIEWLQNQAVQRKPDRLPEPILISAPTPHDLDLTFPFATVEGGAYSTGRRIFEAENRAAVSGACALKVQLDLDSLVNSGTTSSGTLPTPQNTQPPLFFSIIIQGPIHELWCHWTVDEGVRKFESKLLDSCNVLLLGRGEDFVVKLNNIGNWGTGPFMKSLVERLQKVVVKAVT